MLPFPAAGAYDVAVIAGIGIDLVDNARLKAAMRRQGERLMRRIFTEGERRYCKGRRDPPGHYAARFAAKEAVLKALGTGWSGGIRWTDVEIIHDPSGRPEVRLCGRALRAARERKIRRFHLSITHAGGCAAAVAVAET